MHIENFSCGSLLQAAYGSCIIQLSPRSGVITLYTSMSSVWPMLHWNILLKQLQVNLLRQKMLTFKLGIPTFLISCLLLLFTDTTVSASNFHNRENGDEKITPKVFIISMVSVAMNLLYMLHSSRYWPIKRMFGSLFSIVLVR